MGVDSAKDFDQVSGQISSLRVWDSWVSYFRKLVLPRGNKRIRIQGERTSWKAAMVWQEAQNAVRTPQPYIRNTQRQMGEQVKLKLQGQVCGRSSQEEVTSFLLLVKHLSRMLSLVAVSNEQERCSQEGHLIADRNTEELLWKYDTHRGHLLWLRNVSLATEDISVLPDRIIMIA